MIEQQPVFAAPGDRVERKADLAQEILAGLKLLKFGAGQEFMVDQLGQGIRAEVALRHPPDHL